MTYTPEDMRKAATAFDECDLSAMLRAGADAMEREKQARNQALEEAAQTADKRATECHECVIQAQRAELERLRAELAALKQQEPVAYVTRNGVQAMRKDRVDAYLTDFCHYQDEKYPVPLYAAPVPAVDASALIEALKQIANGDGVYGAQAHEYKQIARAALASHASNPVEQETGEGAP
ncbi:hypothetical protein JET14_13515 [Martelella lutilitoris]|uniref:Uncharacterized protein n=1 Tax=Martelella lutilitoris TaxID=2583532 RepID=A0A7T7KK59_9HYPH|nr:hypothetical protein [Martelella lutilitoris]QQM29342.1 hypothetical protein JET14_13515 [Martelella lutilitoris]